jgi:cathepsin B
LVGWDAAQWDMATGRAGERQLGLKMAADPPSALTATGNAADTDDEDDVLGGDVGSWLAPAAAMLGIVGDPSLTAAINRERGLGWVAGDATYMSGAPLLTLPRVLGEQGIARGRGTRLPPSPHLATLKQQKRQPPSQQQPPQLGRNAEGGFSLPKRLDARERWPKCAPMISQLRGQGACGSCWALAAAATLSDRLCIATDGALNVSLSAEAMIDCEANNGGCSGGYLDNAWRFLVASGVPSEDCRPYRFCDNPAVPNCSVATITSSRASPPSVSLLPPPTPPPPSSPSCAATCTHGPNARPPRLYRAANAYAAASVGDAVGMQHELMAHGPLEVAFFVYSDFMHYRSGVYRRSAQSTRPLGAHAVKLVGWGEDSDGTPYWLAANSWSPQWGEKGFFRIRRGTDEVGIESTPAAGLPATT